MSEMDADYLTKISFFNLLFVHQLDRIDNFFLFSITKLNCRALCAMLTNLH